MVATLCPCAARTHAHLAQHAHALRSQARPRKLLNRKERIELAQTLNWGKGNVTAKRSADDLIKMIQAQADQYDYKAIFQRYDTDRSGAIDVTEFIAAIR